MNVDELKIKALLEGLEAQNIEEFMRYVPFFVKDIDGIRHLFPWQSRQPQWLKEYLLLIKTRRGNKHYVVKGLSFGAKFSVKGFSKFKVIGWRELS
jgi:hypothetical protein